MTSTDTPASKLADLVAHLIDQSLAARIDEMSERNDLSRAQRIAWIASAVALRSGLIADLTPKVQRLIDEPGAGSHGLQ